MGLDFMNLFFPLQFLFNYILSTTLVLKSLFYRPESLVNPRSLAI